MTGTRLIRLAHRLLLAVLVALTLYPFAFLAINSLKTVPQFYLHPWWPRWPLHVSNYVDAWLALKPFVINSLLVCTASTLGVLVLGLLAGFAFARYDFPGKGPLYYGVLAMMMVPPVLMLVPSFLLARNLQLIDTYWVMILFYVSGGQVLAIFLVRNAVEAIPEELFNAAAIDGASLFQVLLHIVLPLAKPTLATVAVITTLATWNNFLWPLVTTSRAEVKVVTNGLLEFASAYGSNYGTMFAGYLLAALPMLIVIVLAARAFMRGVTTGAVKE